MNDDTLVQVPLRTLHLLKDAIITAPQRESAYWQDWTDDDATDDEITEWMRNAHYLTKDALDALAHLLGTPSPLHNRFVG